VRPRRRVPAEKRTTATAGSSPNQIQMCTICISTKAYTYICAEAK
jgi:hypothetical protein